MRIGYLYVFKFFLGDFNGYLGLRIIKLMEYRICCFFYILVSYRFGGKRLWKYIFMVRFI